MTWQVRAACADTDPAVFFPGEGQPTEPAKAICSGCPVRVECGQAAIDRGERHGVWGGMSINELEDARRDPETGQLRHKCQSCDDFANGRSPFCDPCRKQHRTESVRRYDQKKRLASVPVGR
ncbi:WhiB family transcriptional regulator [Mycolicibacterium peregrinum]|uniref:WhiB family transcriptional regulator n=1 Tax=Mycolicibacterium peregrinum TaxID=43304 RepID=UPI0006D7BC30|nr:WhiB family transcriptional regulator [Mycolicibacterium peregrinum]MCV7205281.1 WhiB family transcriptional regulator [Mycolicibacterium peregrinum]